MYYLLHYVSPEHNTLIENAKNCFFFEWEPINYSEIIKEPKSLKEEIFDNLKNTFLIFLLDLNLINDFKNNEFTSGDFFSEELFNNVTLHFVFINFNNTDEQKEFLKKIADKLRNTSKIFLFGNKDQRNLEVDSDRNSEVIISLMFLLNQNIFNLEYENEFNFYLQNSRAGTASERFITFLPDIAIIDLYTFVESEFMRIFNLRKEEWFSWSEPQTTYQNHLIPVIGFDEFKDENISKPNFGNYTGLTDKKAKDVIKNKNSLSDSIESYFEELKETLINKSIDEFGKLNLIGRQLIEKKALNLWSQIAANIENELFDDSINLNKYKNYLKFILQWEQYDKPGLFQNKFGFESDVENIKSELNELLNTAKEFVEFKSFKTQMKYLKYFGVIFVLSLILLFIIVWNITNLRLGDSLKISLIISFIASFLTIGGIYLFKYQKLKKKYEQKRDHINSLIKQSVEKKLSKYPGVIKEFAAKVFSLKSIHKFKHYVYRQLKKVERFNKEDIGNFDILKSKLSDLLPENTDYFYKKELEDNIKNNITSKVEEEFPTDKIEQILKKYFLKLESPIYFGTEIKKVVDSILSEFFKEFKNTDELSNLIKALNINNLTTAKIPIKTNNQIRENDNSLEYSFSTKNEDYNDNTSTLKIINAKYTVYKIRDFLNGND